MGRIPIIAVTGTNGKTTTTRLTAHIAKSAGKKVGYTTSDGVLRARGTARSLAENVKRLGRKLGRERVVLPAVPELSLRIVELASEHARVTMADAIRLTGNNRNTLKPHLRALVGRGHLAEHRASRGAWYALR